MAVGSVMRAGLTQRELSLFVAAFASLKAADRNIDWEKFTQLAGYKSVESARVCFRPVIKKLDNFVMNGCPSDTGGATEGAATPVTKTGKASRAKKNTGGTNPAPKRRDRPAKRKLDDEDAVDDEMQPAAACNQAKCHAASPNAMKLESIANDVSLASLPVASEPRPFSLFSLGGEQSGGSLQLVKPAEPTRSLFNYKSGPADTYTGSSPAACDLVPVPGPTPALEPVNDGSSTVAPKSRSSAGRLVGDQLESNEPLAAPSLKQEKVKAEEDGPTQQLIREAAPKIEDASEPAPTDVSNIVGLLHDESTHIVSSGEDAKSVLGGVAQSVSAGTMASQDTIVSVPFQDQSFSYGDSLDFGMDELDGQEDIIYSVQASEHCSCGKVDSADRFPDVSAKFLAFGAHFINSTCSSHSL